MPETVPITVRVPSETAERLEALAAATRRSKSFLGAEAIEEYLTVQEWQIKAIEQGVRSADAGRLVPHDQVEAWVNSWGADDELPKPQCG